ncbi:AraC family transcriptional regulator [Beduini massiliensis]|uniref:AraC family transcriptional regulator n=1 Tax=Beduini massiliensis TaxID=1585974 RepID=UPI00059AA9D0|nr:AraC family transcriptional regulator [Beduini massiliensis]
MEAMYLLQNAITYMEEHLLESISYEATAKSIGMSSYNFHRVFRFMAGMTASEYIRNRRLSLAGQELQNGDILVIDAAYKYGYDTPESFSKAFSRFHGVTPTQAKRKGTELRLFNPLVIKITMEGGNIMHYKIAVQESQKFITIIKAFPNVKMNDENDQSIPNFWTECHNNQQIQRLKSLRPKGKRDVYGLCSPTLKNETHFNYGIGILLDEETDVSTLDELLNSGYSIWETKPMDYVVFKCFGNDSRCIAETWSKFFKEFIPQTGYSQTEDTDYEIYFEEGEEGLFCELWIPVKK